MFGSHGGKHHKVVVATSWEEHKRYRYFVGKVAGKQKETMLESAAPAPKT